MSEEIFDHTDEDERMGQDGFGPGIQRCNVCGRELRRNDEKSIGACAACMNEEIEDVPTNPQNESTNEK